MTEQNLQSRKLDIDHQTTEIANQIIETDMNYALQGELTTSKDEQLFCRLAPKQARQYVWWLERVKAARSWFVNVTLRWIFTRYILAPVVPPLVLYVTHHLPANFDWITFYDLVTKTMV